MELLDEFVKRNPDVHEIFHEGYRRGVIEGFTTAAHGIEIDSRTVHIPSSSILYIEDNTNAE